MFKPKISYCEIQKRKKLIMGLHLTELSDRYHNLNIVQTGRSHKQKSTSSYHHNHKLEFFTPKNLRSIQVTPTIKSPNFLENSQLLVLKQVNIKPRLKQLKPKDQFFFRQLKNQTIDKQPNQLFRLKELSTIPQQSKLKNSIKNSQIEISYPSDYEDFIDYVCNKKLK